MKRMLLIATAALMTLGATAASAQPRPWGDRDHDGIPNRYDRHPNHWDGRGYRDYRRSYYRGAYLDTRYRARPYVVYDYHRYGYRPPPRGYAYYRTDSGDVVMAAIATGLIASVIAGSH